jgi:hypothetical protein
MAIVRYCIISSPGGLCSEVISWDDTNTYYPASGFVVAGDNTGEVGQTYSSGTSPGGTWFPATAPSYSGGDPLDPLPIAGGGTGASDAATALSNLGAAPLASPTFTGTPAAPSAAAYTDTTQIATTAQVYDTVTTVPENTQTGTSYTLVLADAGKLVTLSNAAAITLTIPTNASVAFPVDTRIDLLQYGAGQVTVGGAGVTIRSSGSKLKLTGRYSGATLWKKDTDEWVLIGDITT